VRELLFEHPAIHRVADLSNQPETPDFEFQFEGERVGLEVKSKPQPYSAGYRELWPELDARETRACSVVTPPHRLALALAFLCGRGFGPAFSCSTTSFAYRVQVRPFSTRMSCERR
jgi:hypothetical protein